MGLSWVIITCYTFLEDIAVAELCLLLLQDEADL